MEAAGGSKSQTLILVKAVLESAKASRVDVELVDACKLRINYCNACDVCYAKGKCIHEDDFDVLCAFAGCKYFLVFDQLVDDMSYCYQDYQPN